MGALLRHSELLAWHWFSLLLNTFHPRGETAHTNKPDVQLNQSLRIVTGSLKSTNLKWLPVLANITPPKIRRDVAARKEYRKFLGQEQSLLHHELVNPPPQRLKSRKPFYIDMVDEELDGDQLWRESWRTDPFPANGHLVNDL